jgi:hypothetical protein
VLKDAAPKARRERQFERIATLIQGQILEGENPKSGTRVK